MGKSVIISLSPTTSRLEDASFNDNFVVAAISSILLSKFETSKMESIDARHEFLIVPGPKESNFTLDLG